MPIYKTNCFYSLTKQHGQEIIWPNELKGMMTEKVLMIEPKGVNAFQWPNRLGIYMAANAKWVVAASHDERRFAA
jgi:hypothetical protein